MMKPQLHIPNNAPTAVSAELESTTLNFIMNLEMILGRCGWPDSSRALSLAQSYADAEPTAAIANIDERRWCSLRRADLKLAVILNTHSLGNQYIAGADYIAQNVKAMRSLNIKTRREAEELEQQYVRHEFSHLARAMRAIQPRLP